MEYALFTPASKFQASLKMIRKYHPFIEEIARIDMSDEVEKLLLQVNRLQGNELKDFATKLQNSQLELIFHALIQNLGTTLKEKLIFILSLRLKKRLFHYNWIILQEHYTNPYLIESFKLLTDYMRKKYPEDFNNSFASRMTFSGEDLVYQALFALKSEQSTLNDFLKRYNFLNDSELFNAIVEIFFLSCDKDGYLENAKLFMDWISASENKPIPQIIHYIEIMDVLEYIEEINYLLIELFDLPPNSSFWQNIAQEHQNKFLQWNNLNKMEKYLGSDTEKFLFWKNYYQHIDNVECYPEQGIMFMYISEHVVVDIKNDMNQSYLYRKQAFKIAHRAFFEAGGFKNQGSWPLELEKVVPIKDTILENRNSEIYKLDFKGINKLYIRDFLETVI